MNRFALTPRAKADIFTIWRFIAQDNEAAADRVERQIFEACASLAEAPLSGHTRTDLTSRPVRFWTLPRYPNYTLVYLPEAIPLRIISVLHGKRNIAGVLRKR